MSGEWRDTLAKNLIDENLQTIWHGLCSNEDWAKISFHKEHLVTDVLVVNAKLNEYYTRIDKAEIYITKGTKQIFCGKVQVRPGGSIELQTYKIKCENSIYGDGILIIGKNRCLELRQLQAFSFSSLEGV